MQIEKNVAITNPKCGRPAKYPFRQMQVGDSILADGESSSTMDCPAYNAASQFGRRSGMKFSARKEGANKVRIWRVA